MPKVILGISAAGMAAVTASAVLDDHVLSSSQSVSCEPNVAATTHYSLYSSFGDDLKGFLSFDDYPNDNRGVNKEEGGGILYEPNSSSTKTIPGRVIDAVKASVDTASEWEKKAKERVRLIAGGYPKIYDVSLGTCGLLRVTLIHHFMK